jgi:hypothetical protein
VARAGATPTTGDTAPEKVAARPTALEAGPTPPVHANTTGPVEASATPPVDPDTTPAAVNTTGPVGLSRTTDEMSSTKSAGADETNQVDEDQGGTRVVDLDRARETHHGAGRTDKEMTEDGVALVKQLLANDVPASRIGLSTVQRKLGGNSKRWRQRLWPAVVKQVPELQDRTGTTG